MGRSLRALLRLAPAERRLLLAAWWRLLLAELGFRLLPWRWLTGALAPLPVRRPASPAAPSAEAEALARQVQDLVRAAAAHHLLPVRCLARSVVSRRLLARRGVGTELRIGVARQGGALRAHAWLEHAGEPLGEPEDIGSRYLPLAAPGAEP